jgi:hypothetical protein
MDKTNVSNLPEYRDQLANLRLAPDLKQRYPGVVTQVYPLPAQITALQEVCDELLNSLGSKEDPLPVCFKPAAPWVLAQVCNYGKVDFDKASKGHSWFSQHEVAVGFPIAWYTVKDGKWVFRDWAMLYPFIFVDNPYSMSGGREIYGWSKAGIEVERELPEFAPDQPRCLIKATRKKYEGRRAGLRHGSSIFIQSHPDEHGEALDFFEVSQQRPFLSGRTGMINAVRAVPGIVGTYFAATSGILDLIGRALTAFQDNSLTSLWPFLQRWYGFMGQFVPASLGMLYAPSGQPNANGNSVAEINIITKKQFRDAEGGGHACYQAIVGSCMKIDSALDGGLLFDPISGDASGGVRIKVIGDQDFDLVKELGITWAKHTREGGREHYELRPSVPFWARLDLSYGAATYQCWRAQGTLWSDKETPNLPEHDAQVRKHPVKYGKGDSGSREETPAAPHL